MITIYHNGKYSRGTFNIELNCDYRAGARGREPGQERIRGYGRGPGRMAAKCVGFGAEGAHTDAAKRPSGGFRSGTAPAVETIERTQPSQVNCYLVFGDLSGHAAAAALDQAIRA